MQAKFLILFLCLAPAVLLAKQEQDVSSAENDLELFEFLAMYDKNDVAFIDAEIEDKTEVGKITRQQVETSESDE